MVNCKSDPRLKDEYFEQQALEARTSHLFQCRLLNKKRVKSLRCEDLTGSFVAPPTLAGKQ